MISGARERHETWIQAAVARLLALLACALLASGCAFTTVEVHPTEQRDLPFSANAGRGRELIVVMPFDDKRYEPGRCGMQKNGYNTETADAVCTAGPNRWLADALAQALVKSGYRVLRHDVAPGPTTVIVRGELRQYFLEPKNNFVYLTVEADLGILLDVSSPNGLFAKRNFYVKGTDSGMTSTEPHFQAASDEAAGQIIGSMVRAITQLLDRYPGLGAPSATARVAVAR